MCQMKYTCTNSQDTLSRFDRGLCSDAIARTYCKINIHRIPSLEDRARMREKGLRNMKTDNE